MKPATRAKFHLFGACVLIAMASSVVTGKAEQPFTLTTDTNNRVTIESFGRPQLAKESRQSLREQLDGTEESECRPYGRKSAGIAAAQTETLSSDENSITLRLGASSLSRGGHYRTCGGCVNRNCIGIHGNDTRASARGTTSSTVRLQFSDKLLQNSYELRIALGGSPDAVAALAVTVKDSAGKEISPNQERRYPINAKPGDVYYVGFSLSASSSNEGGCCQDDKDRSVQLTLDVEKGPILDANISVEPFIVGGEPTTAYPFVVAILLDGRLHCSGTIVGAKTVLTAAHCIHGYENAIAKGRIAVVGGTTITQPVLGPVAIDGFDYPRGNDPIQYDPRLTHLHHDIGVLYAKDALPSSPVLLHGGNPAWSGIANVTPLTFVGFGYDKIANSLAGAGIKREAPWSISQVDDWRFYFQVPNKNTCKGDSGGPAFLLSSANNTFTITGVTSAGGSDCSWGMNTRIDAHLSWLGARIR